MAPSTSSPRRSLSVDDLVAAVLTASRALVGVAAASLAGVEGTVSLAQFRMLVMLDSYGETSLNRLADALGVTSASALPMVERLTSAGLVTREVDPANRREVVLSLSRSGAELVWRVTDRRRAAVARIVRKMPGERREDLIAALTAFADAAGEPRDAGPAAFGW